MNVSTYSAGEYSHPYTTFKKVGGKQKRRKEGKYNGILKNVAALDGESWAGCSLMAPWLLRSSISSQCDGSIPLRSPRHGAALGVALRSGLTCYVAVSILVAEVKKTHTARFDVNHRMPRA